jgi:two-component system, chemotaxis family, response regulator Rcp1
MTGNTKLHILLAEDNRGDVLLVRRALDHHHLEYELHVVKDGEEALDFVCHMGKPGYAACPDVMLLDLNLPKADGGQVLREFRRHPQCEQTPVVVITSSDSSKDHALVSGLGVSRYFRKPMDFDDFMRLGEVVREVLA